MKKYEHTRCYTWMEVISLEQDGWELVSVVHCPSVHEQGDLIYFMKIETIAPRHKITTE